MRRRIVFLVIAVTIGIILFAYLGVKYLGPTQVPVVASPDPIENKQVELKRVFSDQDTGFFDGAILPNGRVFVVGLHVSDSKILYLSEDEGKNWSRRTLPTTGYVMLGVSFVQNHGWIVGDGGLVMHTEDSGNKWQMLGQPTSYKLSEVQFVNQQVGYAGGGAEIGCQIFRTQNGGKSWDKVYENLEGGNIFDIAVLNDQTVIAPINDSFLLRTTDGGKTWDEIQLSIEGASGITFTPDGTGWVVGKRGSFYYSADAGRTWQRPAILPNLVGASDWNSIGFADAKRGVAVGKKGAIVVTHDGGKNWREVETDIEDDLVKVRLNGRIALIVGSRAVYRLELPDTF
jgi:photosystem II stability/assembly factor-like uncharacterized protein